MKTQHEIQARVADAAAEFNGLLQPGPCLVWLPLRIAIRRIDEDAQANGVEPCVAQQEDGVLLLILHEIARTGGLIFGNPANVRADQEGTGPCAGLLGRGQCGRGQQRESGKAKRGAAGEGGHARISN